MSSAFKFGELSVSIFGESHGKAIGVVIDGLPGGIGIDFDAVLDFMARRAPKKDGTSTMRSEKDFPNVVSGMVDGVLTGTPLCAVIQNTDQHSADYKSVSHLARPGHADYTGYVRYNGSNDLRGGGHFSGRITAPLVFAGAIASQILESKGITTGAHILSIMDAGDECFDPVNVDAEQLKQVRSRYLPLINTDVEQQMRDVIAGAAAKLDSVGGIIEYAAVGLPAGIGSPMFDGIENRISQAVFGVPAVKGIEFGIGFEAARLRGSENNDPFTVENGQIRTVTNHCGGILGGITDGMPLTFRAAFKPTPSIAKEQRSVNLHTLTPEALRIVGRHDPCIVPRAVPCVEAAAAIAVYDALLGGI